MSFHLNWYSPTLALLVTNFSTVLGHVEGRTSSSEASLRVNSGQRAQKPSMWRCAPGGPAPPKENNTCQIMSGRGLGEFELERCSCKFVLACSFLWDVHFAHFPAWRSATLAMHPAAQDERAELAHHHGPDARDLHQLGPLDMATMGGSDQCFPG